MTKDSILKAIHTSDKKYVEGIINTRMYFTDNKEYAICSKEVLEKFLECSLVNNLTLN